LVEPDWGVFSRRNGPGFDFRVGATPVRIEWSFLAVIAAFGFWIGNNAWAALTWLIVVVVGVLVHEGGHVWALSTFGRSSRVRLSWLSGMTIANDDRPISRGRSVIISLAGPAAGIGLGLLVEGALAGQDDGVWGSVREQSLLVNLLWSAFNLAPVMPLDGGHVTREFFEWCGERTFTTVAAIVGVTANLIAGIVLVVRDAPWAWWVFVFGVLIATNLAFLPLTKKRRQRQEIDRAHEQLMAGELASGIARLQTHLLSPHPELVGTEPRTSMAWALLHQGRMDDLAGVDLMLVDRAHQPLLRAAVAWYRGDVSTATSLVTRVLADGTVDPPATYFQRTFGRLGEVDILRTQISRLPHHEASNAHQRLHHALVAAGRA